MHNKSEEYASKFNNSKKDCILYHLRVSNHGKKYPTHISQNQNSREVRKNYLAFQGNILLSLPPSEVVSLEATTKKRKRFNDNNTNSNLSSTNNNNNSINININNNNDNAEADLDARLERALEIENSREDAEFDDDSVAGGMRDDEEEDEGEGDYQENYYYHDSDDDDKLEEDAEATF